MNCFTTYSTRYNSSNFNFQIDIFHEDFRIKEKPTKPKLILLNRLLSHEKSNIVLGSFKLILTTTQKPISKSLDWTPNNDFLWFNKMNFLM